MKDGYLYLSRTWQDGDRLELDFPMTVRVMEADARVREDIGRVGRDQRPHVVYCMEEADNGGELHLLRASGRGGIRGGKERYPGRARGEAVCGRPPAESSRRREPAGELYHVRTAGPDTMPSGLVFIPYFHLGEPGRGRDAGICEDQIKHRIQACLKKAAGAGIFLRRWEYSARVPAAGRIQAGQVPERRAPAGDCLFQETQRIIGMPFQRNGSAGTDGKVRKKTEEGQTDEDHYRRLRQGGLYSGRAAQ